MTMFVAAVRITR